MTFWHNLWDCKWHVGNVCSKNYILFFILHERQQIILSHRITLLFSSSFRRTLKNWKINKDIDKDISNNLIDFFFLKKKKEKSVKPVDKILFLFFAFELHNYFMMKNLIVLLEISLFPSLQNLDSPLLHILQLLLELLLYKIEFFVFVN